MIAKLIEFQKEQRQIVIGKIDAARATIEREIKELGYYPHNGGRLTAKELYRRAGIGASTLKNKTHDSTRASVNAWLRRMKASAVDCAPRSAKGNDATQLERRLTALARNFDAFKIQYEDIEVRCADLECENQKLRTENAVLRAEKMKVVNVRTSLTSSPSNAKS